MMSSEGLLLVISGPSGCGKGTVCELLKQRNPDMRVSVSATHGIYGAASRRA